WGGAHAAVDPFDPRQGANHAPPRAKVRPRRMARIVVGMSGGVDSSVAAALLAERGHEVVGVTLHLWDYVHEGHAGRCCAPEDQYDARRVCDQLGLPHYTFDRRELFRESVVDPFI